jgi:CRP-like cAMP-binding protein
MVKEAIIDYFSNFASLEEDEVQALHLAFTERRVKRRQLLLQDGDVCKYNTFVVEGCFRMFYIDDKGKEHNIQFAIENWWICNIESFLSDQPSKLYIEALENSVILQIKKEDQLNLYHQHPKFNQFFRVLAEKALISYQKRVLQNISSTAQERYLDFLERYPFFFNRISNVQIASFIGVTPEFLSTIRKNITQS